MRPRLHQTSHRHLTALHATSDPPTTNTTQVVTDCAAPTMTREWFQTGLDHLIDALPPLPPPSKRRVEVPRAMPSSSSAASASISGGKAGGRGRGKGRAGEEAGALVPLPLVRSHKNSVPFGAAWCVA